MKKGDRVKVLDNSYCVQIGENGKFEHGYPTGLTRNREKLVYEVMAKDCELPIYRHFENDSSDIGQVNDVILRNVDTGEVIFTQERFLKTVEPVKYVITDKALLALANEVAENIRQNDILPHTNEFYKNTAKETVDNFLRRVINNA